ncbi:DUF4864 domain-containing protein [Albimonas pacifica]|uniref:DUF4864 domain-containing protein n=1 Tax=Albimonas pacifica TaxID=1114924 RepID=A0A1I3GV52_9RHOB|nr:DUF4864 domain-containing protein [Albimonas pacifica]SFI27314.1 protein of unknown function [Albimonas pacifica]
MPATRPTRPARRRRDRLRPGLRLAAALALALAPAAPFPAAQAQEAGQGADLRAAIEGQLEAFLAGDVEAAWGFASPDIQGLFGSPENFGRMVRQGYPMVWAPAEWRFGELAPETTPGGPRLRQSVILRDASGALWIADYCMMPMEGGWRIDGVTLRKPESTGV